MKKSLAILVCAILGMASYAQAGPQVSGGGSSGLAACSDADYTTGTKTDCAGTPANAKVELDKKANVNASTTGSAGSVKSNATTGIMQITGPAAGSTRVVTIPDANVTIPALPVSGPASPTAGMVPKWGPSGQALVDAGTLTEDNTTSGNLVKRSTDTFENATVTEKLASFAWDGGASAVATASSKRCTVIPMSATIVGAYAIADASTTSHFHVYQDAFAAGARSTTVTGAVDIGATLGSLDTTLTGWDKSITAGDEICISVEANDNAKWLTVIVYGTITP